MGKGRGGFEKGQLDFDGDTVPDVGSAVASEEAKAGKDGKRSWKKVVHTPLENRIEVRRGRRSNPSGTLCRSGTGRSTRARSTARGRRTSRTASPCGAS